MNTQNALKILRDRIENPKTDVKHKIEILSLFHLVVKLDKDFNIKLFFRELRRLIKDGRY
jgi:hypothetical protein